MTQSKLYNMVRFNTPTTGTGTLSIGPTLSTYLSPTLAGVQEGDVVSYVIEDGTDRECGQGAISLSAATLTRTTVYSSTNSNSKIALDGFANVYIDALAQDFVRFDTAQTFTALQIFSGGLTVSGGLITLPGASIAPAALALGTANISISGNAVTASTASLALAVPWSAITGSPTHIAVFGGTAGALSGDSSIFSSQNTAKTAANIYGPASPSSYFYGDSVRGVVDLESGTSIVCGSAFGAYVYNNVAAGTGASGNAGVGFFGIGICAIDHSQIWGGAWSGGDAPTNGLATLTGRKVIGLELDFSCNGASVFEGLSLIMQGVGTPSSANALQVSISSGSTAKWNYGLAVDSGAAVIGASFGALAVSGTSIASLPAYFSGFDASAAGFALKLEAINHFWRLTDNTLATGLIIGHASTSVTLEPTGPSNASLVLASLGTGTVFASTALVAGTTLAVIGTTFLEAGIVYLGKATAVPSNGGTVVLSAADPVQIINPTGGLSTLTVTLPSSPTDGQIQIVAFGQAITTLTVNGGTTVGAPTSIALTAPAFTMQFDAASSKWFRIQ